MVQDNHSVLNITRKKILYIGNLIKNVKEIDIYDCLVWKQLPIFETPPEFIYHNYKVMEDVNTTVTLNHLFMFSVKLNGVKFHGNKLIVEEAKTPRNNLQQK